MSTPRQLPKGIYTPLPCFFLEGSEDIDFVSYKKHVQYTAAAGTIPVISGSMGEASHLSRSERIELIKVARSALDEVNLTSVPIMAGVTVSSTRESILIAKEAATAGADFAIAITPSFYAGTLMANPESIKTFFGELAAASPIPVMMYNFPALTGGIDLDSDVILDIARVAPNICGIKLTCGNVGKLTRITAVTESPSFKESFPRAQSHAPFLVIDGFIDFLLPSIASNSSGAITGLANIAPKSCIKLWKLCQGENGPKDFQKAKELQNVIATADGIAIKIGIPGMHGILHELFGYGPYPRRPILPISSEKSIEILRKPEVQTLLDFEKSLD